MKKNTKLSSLILTGICLLAATVLVLLCRAINQSGLPMTDLNRLDATKESAEETIQNPERTDIMLCYQPENSDTLMLLNLTSQQFEGIVETYPAALLEEYNILAGDFAKITYIPEYTQQEDGTYIFSIRELQKWTQVSASEALANRTFQTASDTDVLLRKADSSAIRICREEYNNYVMIPAGEKYYLFVPQSDSRLVFDEYRKITKTIVISEEETKSVSVWVLCNAEVTDEEIWTALYDGTVSDTNAIFFVGYDSESTYPMQNFRTSDYIYSMQENCIFEESDLTSSKHLTPTHLQIPQIMNDLPEPVQKNIENNWNGSDDVVVFTGDLTEDAVLTFDDDNQLMLSTGTGASVGYIVFYLNGDFFQNISSGLTVTDSQNEETIS